MKELTITLNLPVAREPNEQDQLWLKVRCRDMLTEFAARIHPSAELATASGAQRVIDAVCSEWGVTSAVLMSRCKVTHISEARLVCYYLLYTHAGLNAAHAARVMHRSHHVSTLYGVRRVEALLATYPSFALKMDRVKKALAA